MDENIEMILKKLADLEKKLENYYNLLDISNELDFILNGSYLIEEDIANVLEGKN